MVVGFGMFLGECPCRMWKSALEIWGDRPLVISGVMFCFRD